jgi:transposase-like protein
VQQDPLITEELEDKVIGLYVPGVLTRDISERIKEMYQIDISVTQLSAITDKVIPAMNEWRTRPLCKTYKNLQRSMFASCFVEVLIFTDFRLFTSPQVFKAV